MARKKKKDTEPRYTRRPVSADPNSLAMSISEFARLHGISQDQFFKMQREKWGPTTMKVGSRTLISHEAAERWRREREAETAAKRRERAATSGMVTAPAVTVASDVAQDTG